MRRSDLTICLITDEVSPSLDEGLAFAREEGIGTVDLRVIDGRNVLALSRDELADAARRVRAAGLVSVVHLHAAPEMEPARQDVAKGGRSVRFRARRASAARCLRPGLRGRGDPWRAQPPRLSYLAYDDYSSG